MNKFSRTARSVTFAAIVGLSLGVSAPGAFALDGEISAVNETAGDSPLVNKEAKGKLTIHKFGNPTAENAPSGTLKDLEKHKEDEKLDDVEFTVYKIKKTANGEKNIDLTTNDGLLNAAGLKASDFVEGTAVKEALTKNGVLEKVGSGATKQGQWVVRDSIDLGAYLVVETKPKEGYDPAAPFIAFVPMTEGNAAPLDDQGRGASDRGQGIKWNYDVHAFPKNYKKEVPTKVVKDKDQNNGDNELVYEVAGIARQLKPNVERNQFKIIDKIDPKLRVTKVEVSIQKASGGTEIITEKSDNDGRFFDGNTVNVDLMLGKAKELKAGDKVVVKITTTVQKALEQPFDNVFNTAEVYQNNPDGTENSIPVKTPTVETYWGGVRFKKVDSKHKRLAGAAFQIVRIESPDTCKDVKVKVEGDNNATFTLREESLTPVKGVQDGNTGTIFTSKDEGEVLITGLHVNDFADNAPVDTPSKYCLVETKAPQGKELLAEPLEFQLLKKPEVEERQYELASVKVGEVEGEVVNLDDTTPELPMTGGAGVGILAAIGAAIIGAGAWFARRNSAES